MRCGKGVTMRRGLVLLIAGLCLLPAIASTAQSVEHQSDSFPASDGFTNPCNGETVTIEGTSHVNNKVRQSR
jgi:hypothetical protein